MNKSLICGVFALLALPLVNAGCQNNKPAELPSVQKDANGIEISESVLATAKWMNFDYKGILTKAEQGDEAALIKFLDFHGAVDGIEAINHGVTCLELLPVFGDETFAVVCANVKPKLREVLRERLILAQGRTKKENLRRPIAEWAPQTWYVLRDMTQPGADTLQPPARVIDPNLKKPE